MMKRVSDGGQGENGNGEASKQRSECVRAERAMRLSERVWGHALKAGLKAETRRRHTPVVFTRESKRIRCVCDESL